MTTPEIEELKSLVEQEYGKILSSTTEFEEFTVHLKKKTKEVISASTLKRIYGYVNDEHNPRTDTLNKLARYIGHDNFTAFCKWLKTSNKYNSSFFKANQLVSSELKDGAQIAIGWSPNRILHLRYLGNSTYEVETAENSKLKQGDRFVTGCFIKEQPLYLPYIERDGERTASFVAGRNGGLTMISIIHN